ncbi:hypothetical protein NDU88_006231 [Pleurodeles waltl]|uniref:Uncharacterized protein n=1 Tax=Pleurodeles waltl TaxID=8319 RepID=A0AAV7TCW8_PLEWA|nr:hypothetical protein NDU88_006231 [Pleurodeles waltl]
MASSASQVLERVSVSKETRVDAGTAAQVGISVSLETLAAVPRQGCVRKQRSLFALALARKSNKKLRRNRTRIFDGGEWEKTKLALGGGFEEWQNASRTKLAIQ